MAFGLATLAVQVQNLMAMPVLVIQAGDQEKMMQKQVVGALADHQYNASFFVPAFGLVVKLMAPFTQVGRRPSRWTFQVGLSHSFQCRIAINSAYKRNIGPIQR